MKMAAEVRWLCAVALFIICINEIVANRPHRRFEYKLSFKPPYLAQRDGSVPFWEYGGNAIASSESIRLAPSLRSQKGAIWTKQPVNFDWWEIDIAFRVSGRGRLGADGLAFWYSVNKGQYDGPVFGSSDKWIGLGVFFDSFDNDNKHNNPYISAVLNDGTKEFDHLSDGTSQQLAGCMQDFRNKPFPTRARIEYYKNTLTVMFHNGLTNNDQDYDVCLRAENVVLPRGGHFGVSAATGGLADDHDVFHFLSTSLHPVEQGLPQEEPLDADQKKIVDQYAAYKTKLSIEKEKYKEEHPDVKDEDEFYESDTQRELRQIFAGQSQMFQAMREHSHKLDEVVGRQERIMSLLSTLQTGGAIAAGGMCITSVLESLMDRETRMGSPRLFCGIFYLLVMHSDSYCYLQSKEPQNGGKGSSFAFLYPLRTVVSTNPSDYSSCPSDILPFLSLDVGTPGQAGQPVQMIDTIRRDEVTAVITNQHTVINSIRDITALINDARLKADTILANQVRAPTAQVQSVGYDSVAVVNELRDSINTIKRDLTSISARLGAQPAGAAAIQAPQTVCTNCLTTTTFIVFILLQLVVLLAYSMYKESKGAQAKKFY